jgi:LysM domain
MALRLLVVALVGMALSGCVPTPAGRATASPAATSLGPGASPEVTAVPSVPSTAGPTGSPSFVRPTPKPSPTFLVYEVRAGDTLTSIARQFGTTARSIAYWNRSRYPSLDPDAPTYQPGLIKVGWLLLLIPTAVVDEDELPEPTPEPSPLA